MQRWVTLGATVGKWCGRHLRSQQLLLLQKRVGGLRELETPGPSITAPSFITLPAAQPSAHQLSSSQHSMQQQHRTDTQTPQTSSSHSSMQHPEGDVSSQTTGAGSSSAHLLSSDVEERGWPDGRDGQLQGGSREEGEGHGPRKEFFAPLVGAGMTTTRTGLREEALFIYNESAACYWYNTTLRSSADAQRQYCMAGWLAGQALHNRTDLGIRLAPLLWQKVLQGGSFQASFENVQSFDPAAAQALQKVACMPGQDLAALLQLEDLPLDTSREAYVQHAVQRVCVEDVQWQSASFAQGFCAAVSLDVLQAYIVRPQDLTAMVSGSSTSWQAITGIQDVFHIVLDHQLQTEFQDLVTCLWEVVNAWETELKQHFLFFLTGSRRLPQPHTEVLRIELPFVAFDLKDHTIMLSRLPQVSHAPRVDDDDDAAAL
ncbi:MAG: ubiquitin- ligase [Trebouxia sp. A1-2]|nr:MAG: ubiquitin- ligase [Trebouxia sp. A1-2]